MLYSDPQDKIQSIKRNKQRCTTCSFTEVQALDQILQTATEHT